MASEASRAPSPPSAHEWRDAALAASTSIGEGAPPDADGVADERTRLLGGAKSAPRRRLLRPSPWWYIVLFFCVATTGGLSMAPMLGLLSDVICEDYKDSGAMPPDAPCATDPRVQSGVSTIIGTQTALMGVLSCLTAAWWGSFSDRHGRTRVVALCGLPFIDAAYLLVGVYRNAMPLKYRFVIVGYAVQGLVGGISSLMSIMQAYITDCTDDSSRARAFSLFLGALYAGSAVGPSLGSVLVRLTGRPTAVFAVSTSLCVAAAACSALLVPESVSPAAMADARRRHRDAKAVRAPGGVAGVVGALVGFVRPLGVLLPERGARVEGRWNLVLLAVAYGSFNMIASHSQYILLYAGASLHFSVEMMGYAVSIAGASRTLYLALLFPLVIKALSHIFLAKPSTRPSTPPPSAFGLNLALARASAAFESAVFAAFPLMARPAGFMAAMGAGALGAGFNPTVQSLAVEVYAARGGAGETGKLFGALGVVQALCAYMLGPALFGVICVNTFATAPATLFFVATACTMLAFVTLGFVRSPEGEGAAGGVGDESSEDA
ncbi:MFS general substrate transporter [Phanerochaete sordida]|uniref:MFS general substrate transporter n=1 Tax=Phanerochaete sordida TaxID=48140 RepID=A0A9P3LFR6_9APHY|nr:MFS general substrate transporter [Phanerochaete sordida]